MSGRMFFAAFLTMEKIRIGKIVSAQGLKGEVKVYNYSDRPERYEELDEIIVSGKKTPDEVMKIQKVRYMGNMVILKLEGVDDRNASESLRDRDVFITEADLKELPEDTFYVRDLIGMKVVDMGQYGDLGVIKDVIQNSAQDVYVVSMPDGREIMIPAVKDFIKEVSLEEKTVRTTLIPGFVDEGEEA